LLHLLSKNPEKVTVPSPKLPKDVMKEKIRTEVVFEVRNGRTLSRKKDFYENGKLAREGIFGIGGQWSWDIPIGVIKTYHTNGVIKFEEQYDENGNKDGEFKTWNDQGVLVSSVFFVKDKKTSEELFDRLGNVIRKSG
jgi:antitoxin component YwqK of YwqJK toxin-antitoxin module